MKRPVVSTPGAKVPPFDPFQQGQGAHLLPRGTRITLLLSRTPVLTPIGLRAVSGEVVGFAVASPHWLDIRLERMVTWIHDNPPSHPYEILPSSFRSTFRVEIAGSVRRTIALLKDPGDEGRTTVCAVELPCKKCWRCGADVEGRTFCSNCGWRASVGQGPLPTKRPRGRRTPFCPGCWTQNPPRGRFCAVCGLDWSLVRSVRELAPRYVDLVYTSGHQRFGRIHARMQAAIVDRLNSGGKPKIIFRIDQVRNAAGEFIVSEDFSTVVVVSAKMSLSEAVRRLLAGERLQVSEPVRRCDGCIRRGDRQGPLVLGRYCTKCGSRGRLFMHPGFGRHVYAPPLRVLTHTCGTRFLESAHAYCGGCGQDLGYLHPGLERFARLR